LIAATIRELLEEVFSVPSMSRISVEIEHASRQSVESRSEKLSAWARDLSVTRRKGNVRRWKPLPRNG
jgi:hypothetical protein